MQKYFFSAQFFARPEFRKVKNARNTRRQSERYANRVSSIIKYLV